MSNIKRCLGFYVVVECFVIIIVCSFYEKVIKFCGVIFLNGKIKIKNRFLF